MDSPTHVDGNSIMTTLVTLSFIGLSWSDLEIALRICASVGGIVVIITAVWLNIVKIKNYKKGKDDEEQ